MRAIDADRLQKQFDEKSTNPNYRVNIHNIKSIIYNAPTIEVIPKADYENRLKADKVAMLEELQLEIEELKSYESADGQDLAMLADIGILFQQKINKLKGEENVDTGTEQTETH